MGSFWLGTDSAQIRTDTRASPGYDRLGEEAGRTVLGVGA